MKWLKWFKQRIYTLVEIMMDILIRIHTHTQPSGGWEEKWTLSESDHNLMKNGNTLEFLCLDSTLSPEHH